MIFSGSIKSLNLNKLLNTNRKFLLVISHKRLGFLSSLITSGIEQIKSKPTVLFIRNLDVNEVSIVESLGVTIESFPFYAYFEGGRIKEVGHDLFALRDFINSYL